MFRRKINLIIAIFLSIVIISLITNNPKNSSSSAKASLKIPAAVGYVNDFAGVISPENKNNLDFYLKELDKKTGAEIAVVTLASLEGNNIEDVSLEIGRKWGIGKKEKNNGVVILVATGDKKMRIEVGYGLEGIIPDGKAGRIRDEYMIPSFRQGNMEQGIINGTIAVASEISKAYKAEMPAEFNSYAADLSSSEYSQTSAKKLSGSDIIVFLIFIIIFMFLPRREFFIGGYGDYGEGFGGSSGCDSFGGFGGGDFGGGGSSGGW